MNLELIRKYEKEFLHMLHGGNLLVKCTDKSNVSHKDYLDWHCDSDVFESKLDYLIVIDDKYLPYRKAAAEGKQLQSRDGTDYFCSPTIYGDWNDTNHISFCMPVDCYRIKPEESIFKVGDWIKQGTRVFQYTYKDLQYDKANPTHCQNDEKWEPKEGEICIFWDDNHTNHAVIARYSHYTGNSYYPLNMLNSCYTNCMPFTGVLPPHMKDNE